MSDTKNRIIEIFDEKEENIRYLESV